MGRKTVAMIDPELLPRAREIAQFLMSTPCMCANCNGQKMINLCESGLTVIVGTAMTETKLGGPEAFAAKQEELFGKKEEN